MSKFGLLKGYYEKFKGSYQRIDLETQKITNSEPIKSEKTELYELINQLSTEKAKDIATCMALKKGLIDGTEPEFQPLIKSEFKSLDDLNLLRHVMGNLAMRFYHPYSDMYSDPKLSEDNRKNLYEGAKKAWEEACQFILSRTLADRNGDKESYKLYDNLARLLEDNEKSEKEDKKPNAESYKEPEKPVIESIPEKPKSSIFENIIFGGTISAMLAGLVIGTYQELLKYKQHRRICNEISTADKTFPQSGLEIKVND